MPAAMALRFRMKSELLPQGGRGFSCVGRTHSAAELLIEASAGVWSSVRCACQVGSTTSVVSPCKAAQATDRSCCRPGYVAAQGMAAYGVSVSVFGDRRPG